MTTEPACRVHTLCLHGSRAEVVEVELQYTGGLMQRIVMTGLPGGAVKESRDRIRGCLQHCGLPVPRRSVLANFAPADLHKEGNGFDLPLALGILSLGGVVAPEVLARRAIVGEIALDGRLRPIRGALTLALRARRDRSARLMLPWDNGAEAALVGGLAVEPVRTLQEALEVLGGRPPPQPPAADVDGPSPLDLRDVRGQASGRRALEIAATGGHNLLLTGPPGTGKTMLAQRLPGLLPPLDESAALEVSALHGLAGTARIVRYPPFRSPHHTISRMGLVGGGRPLCPGEVSLAHRGVLFLDELAEFPRSLLDSLRQPLEDGRVHIARAGRVASFPSRVQLVGAMNPCPCGYLGHPRRGCRCTAHAIDSYRRRISGPLLDRFDLHVDVPVPEARELLDEGGGESSADVGRRVAVARARPAVTTEATRERPLRARLERAIGVFGLSGRAVRRTLAVAASIARLEGRDRLAVTDLEEALSFRRGLVALLDGSPGA